MYVCYLLLGGICLQSDAVLNTNKCISLMSCQMQLDQPGRILAQDP